MRPFRFSLALGLSLALAACAVTESGERRASGADGLMAWPDLLERPRPEPSATVSYGEDALQVVDLWLPDGAGPHPTVLMVHGGCWQTEIADRRIMNWIADDLRRRGIAVWNIDYRGVDRPGGGYPGTFLDAAAAADALRTHAAEYNIDLHPLVAIGHSAGGHLALWLGARPIVNRRHRTVVISLPVASFEEGFEAEQMLVGVLEGIAGATDFLGGLTDDEASATAAFASHEAALAAAAEARRGVARMGFRRAEVAVEAALPAGSPLAANDPIQIDEVISLGGLPDLEEAARPPGSGCGTEVIAQIAGAASDTRPDPYVDTSVPRLARLEIPQVLINGRQDRIIPTAYAEDYAATMRAAGDHVIVRMIDRTGHVELIAPETAAWAAAVEEIEAALARHPDESRDP